MNVSSLRLIFEQNGIKTRALTKGTEFAICCYKCGDTKFRMYVNPNVVSNGIRGWCHCHRKGCNVPLALALAHFKIKISLQELEYKPTSFEAFKAKMKTLEQYGEIETNEEPAVKIETFDFDQFKSPLKSNSFMAKKALNYLTGKRGFTDTQIKRYDLRYADSGDYSGRIIIPTYEYDKLVYFQARGFTVATSKKILNPPLNAFIGGKSDYLYNFDQARLYREVTITEGWGSAIAAGYDAVAINGNDISPTQLDKLVSNWDQFVVMLDHGVEDKTYQAMKLMLFHKPKIKIKAVFLPFGDPNNYDPPLLQKLKARARVYTSLDDILTDEIRFFSSKRN